MKINVLIILIVFTLPLFAQVEEALRPEEFHNPEDSLLVDGWNPLGVIGLNLSQVAFKDWTQGGSNSLAFVAYTNMGVAYLSNPWKWKNMLKAAYGRTNIEDAGYRTTDNEIYFESLLSRNIGWAVDPYFALTVRTPITKGYDYAKDPAEQIVDFFDPGYITEALGFIYEPSENFSSRLGVAIQQTIADQFALQYTDDPETVDEVEKFKFDTGLESVTAATYEFLENMQYGTFLRLFSRFNSLDVWDVRWDNVITAKVNQYINVNFAVTLIHEISQSRRTQLREALQIGIVYTLF
ncbi:MAG TPA: DUF3078 domain-containing protein [Ignavibacteriaceae bacterium]|nr:DUF3078 domain-containing protein [Ignavibacteriaceae bacterium]